MKNENSRFKKLFENFENMKDENKDKLLKVGEKISEIESLVFDEKISNQKQVKTDIKNE